MDSDGAEETGLGLWDLGFTEGLPGAGHPPSPHKSTRMGTSPMKSQEEGISALHCREEQTKAQHGFRISSRLDITV